MIIKYKLKGEMWVPIKNTNEIYWVSNKGRVCSLKKGTQVILKNNKDKHGYFKTYLRINGKIINNLVHRIVAHHFIKNKNKFRVVHHIDGNPSNNKIENLMWTTYSKNLLHAYATGLKKKTGALKILKDPPKKKYLTYKEKKKAIKSRTINGVYWKPVKKYNREYWVSNTGVCLSFKRGNIRTLKYADNRKGKGYCLVCLSKNNKRKLVFVHRLVGKHFIKNYKHAPEINHKDRNPKNNNVSNLEWVTKLENMEHAAKTGAFDYKRKPITKETRAKMGLSHRKNIYQWSLHGKLIKIWDSITEASKTLNISDSNMSSCAKNVRTGGKRKVCGGYQWSYSKSSGNIIKNIIKYRKRKMEEQSITKIKVHQIKNCKIIKTWPSLKKAATRLHLTRSSIKEYLDTKKEYAGFIWQRAA